MMSAHVPMTLKNFLPDDSCDGAPGSKGIPLYEQNPAVPSHFLPPLFFMFSPLHSPHSLSVSGPDPRRSSPALVLTPNLGLMVCERFFFAVGPRGVLNLFQTCLVKRQFDMPFDCRTWCGGRWTWSRPGGRRRRRCCRTPG